jgi:hypothetical protein
MPFWNTLVFPFLMYIGVLTSYAHSQNIRNQIILMFGSKQTKRHKQDFQNQLRLYIYTGVQHGFIVRRCSCPLKVTPWMSLLTHSVHPS